MENLTLFIAITAAAVVIQACILIALYLAVRRSSARMEALATEVKTKTLPAIETAHALLLDLRPKIDSIADNVSHTTTTLRAQMDRLDATVSDVIDRTRLQVIRADELVNRTMDKVEETTELVHRTVVSPLRQVSGLLQGLTAGFEFLVGRRRRHPRDGMGVPQDEMFI
jgi:outer membrane murein-binding lipoprotein Lpp